MKRLPLAMSAMIAGVSLFSLAVGDEIYSRPGGCPEGFPCPSKRDQKPVSARNPMAETGPAPSATAPDFTVAYAAPPMMSYNVIRGDTLWSIASKPTIYGNPYQWPLILKANRDTIKDADLIEPGQVLLIEKRPSAVQVNAAVQHAKIRGEAKLGLTEQADVDYLERAGVVELKRSK